MKVDAISVLISTYNRAVLLRDTLTALQASAQPMDCAVEIIVVDNNSTDDTPAAVAEAAELGPYPVISLREPRQGKSFALNLGLAHARGDVIALTDDDVLPAKDWLVRIVSDFRERDITFVFGKVLPRWGRIPPPELLTREAQDIWGPLAILDYGDDAVAYTADNHRQRLPVGANLALTRRALTTVGGWRTDLGRVNNTLIAGEDHDLMIRLRRAMLYSGYYDPAVMVRHWVPPARLSRSYFRRWFFWLGKTQAIMLDDLYMDLDLTRVPHVLGVPRFLYRQAFAQTLRYVRRVGRHGQLMRFIEELRTLQFAGLLFECGRRRVRKLIGAA